MQTTMKALVKSKATTGIWMEEVPIPECGPNDLLIKIRKTAICGTDIHIYKWDDWAKKTIPVPMVVGHEFSGVVAKVGSHVQGFEIGDRVSGEGHIVCGYCRNCRAGRRHLCRNTKGVGVNRTGAFAEYLVIPAFNAFRLPEGISDDIAAFLDPLGNATHTVLSFDLVGEDILITGAGPIGCMAVAICKHVGCRRLVITDINPYRLELARKMGADLAIDPREMTPKQSMSVLGLKEGFDVGFEMSGNSHAFGQLIGAMNHGGRIGLLGIPPNNAAIDWNDVIFKGLTIKGIYGREMFETWYKMASMLLSGLDMSPILTHHFPIDSYQEGFETMLSGQSGKVILNWEE
jgi:threonine 3-dehydrogenase